MTTLLLSLLLASAPPLALRAEVQALGKGPSGIVVGVAVQVAPEDRERAGTRVSLKVVLLRGGAAVDTHTAVVELSGDGSALLYREWPAGEGQVRVFVEALEGGAVGAWSGPVKIPMLDTPFEAPAGAGPDAVALTPQPPPPAADAVRFLPPPREGGIGALQLELSAPSGTARVAFFQDGEPLGDRQRQPWTVSVSLGQIAHRTVVSGQAFGANGEFLGEDALVLNAPPQQIPVELLLGPPGGSEAQVTVSVARGAAIEGVVLKLDDRPVARWTECPCVVRLPRKDVDAAKVIAAEVAGPGGTRGEAVQVKGLVGYQESLRVEVVELPVNVFDATGAPVADLSRDAFRVFEDGQEVAVEAFGTTAELPLSLGIVVDTSGSMVESFPAVRKAVADFASQLLRPQDSYFLLTFSFEPQLKLAWGRDADALGPVLDRITPEGGTSLRDAVVRGLEQFRGRRGRMALVVLTDGDDTTSRTGWGAALRYIQTARVPVFPIGFQLSAFDFMIKDRLKDLAATTGGDHFVAPKSGHLEEAYARINRQLRSQYLITYRSSSSKGREVFRTVRVEVKGKELVARTISGYYPAQ
ncbi:MAG TPA: VWA domain-containing protein [Thermoanaerobaculaceae bacterium]|nr:VWA domain-containing protein [Thermoanaerobaculaceae bacterium]